MWAPDCLEIHRRNSTPIIQNVCHVQQRGVENTGLYGGMDALMVGQIRLASSHASLAQAQPNLPSVSSMVFKTCSHLPNVVSCPKIAKSFVRQKTTIPRIMTHRLSFITSAFSRCGRLCVRSSRRGLELRVSAMNSSLQHALYADGEAPFYVPCALDRASSVRYDADQFNQLVSSPQARAILVGYPIWSYLSWFGRRIRCSPAGCAGFQINSTDKLKISTCVQFLDEIQIVSLLMLAQHVTRNVYMQLMCLSPRYTLLVM